MKSICNPHRQVYSAFIDILLAVVPTAAFWKLQLKTKTKVGLCLLMGMTAVYGLANFRLNPSTLIDMQGWHLRDSENNKAQRACRSC